MMTRPALPVIALVLTVMLGAASSAPTVADAWTGRRAVLLAEAEVMLARNDPWIKVDCSLAMWKLIKGLWPELRLTKWFKRTTADAMAGWPWPPVMSLDNAFFGDLLFANSEEYPKAPEMDGRGAACCAHHLRAGQALPLQGCRNIRPARADFFINHVLMQWIYEGSAIHSGKKRGCSETRLWPYWQPRLVLIIRPPY